MLLTEDDRTDKVCVMCGDKGYPEQLITCSQCRKTSQHGYCIMNSPNPVLEAWLCETCEYGKKQTSQPSSRSVSFKPKESAKVKFISTEEVASLESGSKTPVSVTKECRGASIPGMSHILKQASLPSRSIFSRPTATSSCLKKEMMEGSSYVEEHASPLKVVKPVEGKSRVRLPLSCDDQEKSGLCAGIQQTKSDLKGICLSPKVIIVPTENKIHWRGRLVVTDMVDHIYEGIEAHFPGQISMKAYIAAKAMPETLKFSLINRLDVWPHIFQLDPPSCDDVAMHVLPSELGRPKEKYIRLLERMDKYDLAMRCHLDSLELLIYTSNLLLLDPSKNMTPYLWGIFCHRRRKEVKQEAKSTGESNCDLEKSPTKLLNIKNYQVEENIPCTPRTPPGFCKLSKGDSGCKKVNFALEYNSSDTSPDFHKLSKKDLGGEENVPQVPPGFFKLSKGDLGGEKKIPQVPPKPHKLSEEDSGCEKVKFTLKKPVCHTISKIPPGFSPPPKHGSGSYEHTVKDPTSQKYAARRRASLASRERSVTGSLNTEKVSLAKDNNSGNMVMGQAGTSRSGDYSKKASPGSAGHGSQRSPFQTSSMPLLSSHEVRGRLNHAADDPSGGQNADSKMRKLVSSISSEPRLPRLQCANDRKQWVRAAAGERAQKPDHGQPS